MQQPQLRSGCLHLVHSMLVCMPIVALQASSWLVLCDAAADKVYTKAVMICIDREAVRRWT